MVASPEVLLVGPVLSELQFDAQILVFREWAPISSCKHAVEYFSDSAFEHFTHGGPEWSGKT
jgi:hypothetical protein